MKLHARSMNTIPSHAPAASRAAIGVDIGGTSIKLGVVTGAGRLVFRDSFLTNRRLGRARQLDRLVPRIFNCLKESRDRGLKLAGVGMGVPGPVDVRRGFVYSFPNIPGWKNTPLKAILRKAVPLPVWVDNDASVMALGECLFGAGRGSRNVIALTLGTGVGGGLIIDGRLFSGPRFSASELGHLVINEEGPLCSCGNHGCVEAYVGSRAFVKEVLRRLRRGERSLLKRWIGKEGRELTPLLVAQAARSGDTFSKRMWHRAGEHLGTALAGLCNLLNPEKIILGGGIALNGRLLFDPVVATIQKKAFPIAAGSVRVIPARLGVDAGLIGAAALAFTNQDLKESC